MTGAMLCNHIVGNNRNADRAPRSADTPVPGTGAGLSQAAAGERRGERERGGASDPLEDLGAEVRRGG